MSFDKCSQYQQFCVSIGEVTTSNKRALSQEFIWTMGESISSDEGFRLQEVYQST